MFTVLNEMQIVMRSICGQQTGAVSNTFPGHMLAAVGDVVVVTVNYRLGALGKSIVDSKK